MIDYSTYSDQDLWVRVCADDNAAFDVLYRRHWSQMLMSAYRVLEDQEICRDLIQDVFTELWTKRKETQIENMSAYLKVSVRNKVFRHMRRGYVSQKHLETIELITQSSSTEDQVNFNQLKERYEASVAQLPDRCREVFRLSRFEHLTVKEIAERLQISPKTVENQMTKALKILRTQLGETVLIFIFTFLF